MPTRSVKMWVYWPDDRKLPSMPMSPTRKPIADAARKAGMPLKNVVRVTVVAEA